MIEVGEYVRLKNGEIFKIDENTANYYNSNKEFITNEIVKHSKNLIDLIQVGDILKIEISKEWTDDEDRIKIIAVGPTFTKQEIIKNVEDGLYKIKSIVTKEQFKLVEYIVGESNE